MQLAHSTAPVLRELVQRPLKLDQSVHFGKVYEKGDF